MATTCLPFVKPWEELFREGAAAYADRDFAVAADCYQQAIQLAPESAAAHYNLGNVLL